MKRRAPGNKQRRSQEDAPPIVRDFESRLASEARANHPTDRILGKFLANWLFPLYVLMITAGYFALRSEGAMTKGNELGVDRALFASVNAATLTGFQSTIGLDQYLPPAQYTILALTIGATLFSTIVGGLACVRILRLPYSDARVVRDAFLYTAIFTFAGALALLPGRSLYEAYFLSTSAFGNSGLHMGDLPGLLNWQTHLVLMPLATLGGVGLPVLMELLDRARRKREALSFHSRTVLAMTGGAYLILLGAFLMIQTISHTSFTTAAASSSVAAINSRTAGLQFQYAYAFPRAMQWALMLAMFIGASPAGTAGGFKLTTLVEVFRGARRILRDQPVERSFAIALTWLGLLLFTSFACLITLLATDPQIPADRILFQSLSAATNTGLSYDPISTVGPGLYTLTATMFLGRVLPLLVLWWQADTTTDADLAIG